MRKQQWFAGAMLVTAALAQQGWVAGAWAADGKGAFDGKGTFTVALDNDLFGKGDDKHYTHGTEITYVSAAKAPEQRAWLFRLPMFRADDETRIVWSLGQQMYTPENTQTTALIETDRPYAGWLYTSVGLLGERNEGIRRVHKLDLIVGIVGPDSGAKNVQRAIHKITDSDLPRGWDNQLDDEVTVDLQYQSEWMVPLIGNHVDVVPQVVATLGSSQRFAGVGMTFRVGTGLGSDYGPPLIQATGSGSHHFKPNQAFFWYLFAGANGRYVGHNIFLDGNHDGNSHSVERKEWVGDIQAGMVLGWSNWRVTVTNIVRSREFDGQGEPDEFGSIAVSYRY